MHIDGARNRSGVGIGIILNNGEGVTLEYALRLNFNATNNMAEYEALLMGLK